MRYPLKTPIDGLDYIIVATTRPETMLGDTAVAVNPNDERYKNLVGTEVLLPLTDRTLPVIADDYVDQKFGTGCVKITPAHDFNDYEMSERHKLKKINIFTIDAALNDEVPEKYRGMDRYEARKQIVADLEQKGLLEKIDDHKLMVPRGDRSHAVVEPYLTDQWYVKIQPLADPAIKAVKDGDIKFVPANWDKTYFDWMNNIQDWCISRQLWWGHRIPAWYDDEGNIYVGHNEAAVREKNNLGDINLKQDEDVLDTWFSSALWPFSTLGWPEKTPELDKFYPTNVLVTGFDIIFFWVARMIMFGLKFMDDVPFKEVYIHGLIRDGEGQKMSKSKGNVLDPIDLIDGIELEELISKRTSGMMQPQMAVKIEKTTRKHFPDGIESYGTDSLRFTFASLATQGRFINFETGRIQGYRNFCNKLWNAARYVISNVETQSIKINEGNMKFGLAERWITSKLSDAVSATHEGIKTYRFDLASQALYEFTWDEYCDWYIELSKITLNGTEASEEEKRGTLYTLLNVLETLQRALHPFMPFITEELWHRVAALLDKKGESVMLESFPNQDELETDNSAVEQIEWIKSFIMGVRRIRAERDISPGKSLTVFVRNGNSSEHEWLDEHKGYLETLGRLESINNTDTEINDAVMALAGEMTLLVPLADFIDPKAEKIRLESTIDKLQKEKAGMEEKLNNKKFVERAPVDVVEGVKQKLADKISEIKTFETQLQSILKLIDK
jgi:valyl-tRNA synthetase